MILARQSNCYISYHDVDYEALLDGQYGVEEKNWLSEKAKLLNALSSGLVFKISELQLPLERSRALAIQTARGLSDSLKALGAPSDMYVEVDHLQKTHVVDGHTTRTLIPHHDGGHASYLTPSVLDVPSWSPKWRVFSDKGVTSDSHKLYQGFFLHHAGEGESLTSYYDLLKVIRASYLYQHQTSEVSIQELQNWLGGHLIRAFELRRNWHFNYINLGTVFGSPKPEHLATDIHYMEAPLKADQKSYFPEIATSKAKECDSETEYVMNEICSITLGLDWQEFRKEYESALQNTTFDFVIGHNLNLLHGGLNSGSKRLLEPICLVMKHPLTLSYEEWLSKAWRKHQLLWG